MMDADKLQLCEKPVKELIRDYFEQFASHKVINWCRLNRRKLIQVPETHRSFGNVIATLKSMPVSFMQPDSLLHMPEETRALLLEKPNGEVWGFRLHYNPGNRRPVWNEEVFDTFGKQTAEAKKRAGMLITCVQMYAQDLCHNHRELRGIELALDKETMALHLKDNAFPGYRSEGFLYLELRVYTPEEVDAENGV